MMLNPHHPPTRPTRDWSQAIGDERQAVFPIDGMAAPSMFLFRLSAAVTVGHISGTSRRGPELVPKGQSPKG
jgi:hypothetical protein